MRRLAVIVLLVVLICPAAYADVPFHVDAKAAVLIEANTGRVLYAQNANEMLPMASTTKIMTALLAVENGTLSDVVTAPAEACGITGTSIYLTEGESLTLEQLLYGLMLRSGNDAAAAIAIHIAGGQAAFVDMMNSRAREMAIDASFANPHGLDAEGHKASALALAQIMRAALQHEEFARITSTKKKIIPWEGNEYSRLLYNKNRLLTSYEGTVGGKTGYTSKAGRCLVFAAERNGMTLIGCVLNCSTWFDTAERLLDYGFENYGLETPYGKNMTIETVEVTGGQQRSVGLLLDSELTFPLGIDEDYTVNLEIDAAAAPISSGAAAGRVNIIISGETVATAGLVYAESIAKNDLEGAINRVFAMWLLQS